MHMAYIYVHMTFQNTDSDLRRSLREVVREWGLMHEHPCVSEVTLAQGHALIELEGGLITVAELALRLLLDQSSASRLVARLVKSGWVEMHTDRDDRRKRYLRLTKSGRKVLAELHRQSNERTERALGLLSPEEQQHVQLGMKLYARALRRTREQGSFNLRPIKRADNAAMADVIRRVMPEFGADVPGFALHDQEVDKLAESYARPRSAYFVVERAGVVCGGAGIAPLEGGDKSVCELRKMYLLPTARGFGLGERLLRACLERAQEYKFERCYLETSARMVQAQALYTKLGFVALPGPIGNTGHFACDKWYELKLVMANSVPEKAA